MDWYFDALRQLGVYPRSDVLLTAIPEARQINGAYVAVPHTLRNAQVLRHFQYPVAPVITDANYDWPIEPGKRPLPHQKVCTNFQLVHPKSCNLGDPGTMKTLSALWMADYLMRQHPPGTMRCLIVGPLTILETVWASGIFRAFLSHRTFEVLHGSSERRRKLLALKPDFAIVNFDGVGVGARTGKGIVLDGFSKDLVDDKGIQIVIVDEGDSYCDARTKKHRIARMVFANRQYLTILTGTPTPKAPSDAYGIAKLINNAWGKSFTTFRSEVEYKLPYSQFRWVPQRDGYEKSRRLLAPAIRYSIEDVWQDAPPMTTQARMVALTDEQKKMLAALKRDLQVEMRSGATVNAINEAAARQKYLQIVLGAVYDADHNIHRVAADPRFDELRTIIERTDRKVLIFVGLTSMVHILHKKLSETWGCEYINGEVSKNDRTEIIQRFETDPKFRILVADPLPVAYGINQLVAADTVVWYGPTEKSRLYVQSNKRAHRPGQRWPVSIYQLVATQLERDIFARLEQQTTLQGTMLSAIQRGEF